ncbi:bile acid:sodium symporter family protein [Stratiformator vulcanicus]|uniref:Sodium Bile acid symporter family protein n=1 Tax=Stratiformator vulcanicus TaxID=2527980 RepID=A0A517R4F0_9PLAN|nr:bile acid:sodium symporter family protein [Stratiformator vulcanicus]QDT38748.1 Sodium Bile acid symporter family protein [Stratiformator vulcanicus]
MQHLAFALAVVAAAVLGYVFPGPCTAPFGIELKPTIVPLLQVIMFGMGATMTWRDFGRVATQPWGVFVGLICQFTIMPLLGWTLARTFGFPDEIAAGLILIGCCPSGLSSNVITYIAKANVPLSITLTSCATLLGPFVTPPLMKYLAGAYIEVNAVAMMWSMVQIVLLPIAGGLVFNAILGKRAEYLHQVLPIVSMASIAIVVAIITALGRDAIASGGLFLIAAVATHNVCGFGLGYGLSRLLRLGEQDCRTVAIEVGMQNGGLASALAASIGKAGTMGAAPVIFATMMNITGPFLAAIWSRGAKGTPGLLRDVRTGGS